MAHQEEETHLPQELGGFDTADINELMAQAGFAVADMFNFETPEFPRNGGSFRKSKNKRMEPEAYLQKVVHDMLKAKCSPQEIGAAVVAITGEMNGRA